MKKVGAFIAVLIGLTLLALFLDGFMPIPSSYIFVILSCNIIFAFASIFSQRVVTGLYEANVFEGKKGFVDYLFQYIAIILSGINYYAQLTFSSYPFLIRKVISIAFLLSLMWILAWVMAIFD